MKEKLSAIMTAAALILSLAACSSPTADMSRPPEPSDVPTGSLSSEEVPPPKEPTASISETVLLDEAGVRITAKSLDDDALFGPEFKLLIENDSGEDLTFQCRNASVNGYMIDTMISVDVVNGKKTNDSLTFMRSALDVCGIGVIADMEFSFHIFTSKGWDTYLDTPQIQLKTSVSDTYGYVFDDSGDLVYDEGGVKIVIKGLAEDSSIFGPSIVVYIENSCDKDITVQARDVSVNGYMVDPIFSSDVAIGKHAIDTITFMSSELEENEIAAIENAELSFHIFDAARWDTIADTDPIAMAF